VLPRYQYFIAYRIETKNFVHIEYRIEKKNFVLYHIDIVSSKQKYRDILPIENFALKVVFLTAQFISFLWLSQAKLASKI
jgi:hypothetical protein